MGRNIFVDWMEDKATAYVLEIGRNSSRVVDNFNLDLSEGASPAAAVADIDESFLSLPLSMLDFRIMELPFADIKKIKEVLPLELENVILDGSSSVVFDARIVGPGKVLVIYIRKEKLAGILKSLKSLGLDPRVVTSLELSSALEGSTSEEELSRLLISPTTLDENERVNLAVRETGTPVINLRSGDLVYTADTEKTGRSLMWSQVLLAMLFIVFFSDMAFRIITVRKDITSTRDAIRKTYMGLFPQEKKVSDELYQLKAHFKEMKEKENSYLGVSPLRLLLDLTKFKVPGLSFSEITIDKERLILKGECNSLSDVQLLKGKLDVFLLDVTVTDAKPGQKGRTLFAVTAKGRRTL